MSMKTDDKDDFLIKEIRSILAEQDAWDGYVKGSDFAKVFITPFTNVLNVAKVAFKDILTSVVNVTRQAWTFDLDDKKELQQKYNQAKQKLDAEYKEAMAPIDEALASSDAKMLSFAFNPAGTLGIALAGQAAELGTPIIDVAAEKLGLLADWDPEEAMADMGRENLRSAGSANQKGPVLGLMSDLSKIFFSPVSTAKDVLIGEQDEESESPPQESSNSDDQAIEITRAALEETGMLKQIDALADDILSQKEQEVKELETRYLGIMQSIEELKSAESMKQAETAAAALGKNGIEGVDTLIVDLKKAVEEQYQDIKENPESDLKSKLLTVKSPLTAALTPDSPAEDFLPIIEKTFLASAVQGQFDQAAQDMFKEIMEHVSGGLSKAELDQLAQTSPKAKKYRDLIVGLAEKLSSK